MNSSGIYVIRVAFAVSPPMRVASDQVTRFGEATSALRSLVVVGELRRDHAGALGEGGKRKTEI
jgi:hypothetical protein